MPRQEAEPLRGFGVEIERGVEKVLREAAREVKNGYIDPQELRNLGMVLLSAALMSEESYFFALSNALYTLADALSSFLRVTSVPLSLEVRGRAEKRLEEVRSDVSHYLARMADAVVSGDQCGAMQCAASLLAISYKVNSMAENFRNVLTVQLGEEE